MSRRGQRAAARRGDQACVRRDAGWAGFG